MAEPTQLAYRTLKGIGVFNAAPVYETLAGFAPYVIVSPGYYDTLTNKALCRPEGHFRCCTYSPDGKFFAWASPERYVSLNKFLQALF
jgi:translation initiation factor 2A